ncbi:hypothetical protein [Kitasatospora arboriphila]|uniref:GNAT family N-acetyltransferase n=1 Tax=Kitasatospora arboriphila TaxID=258052 RepID=A0ABP4DW21_9ACTN
MPTFAAVTAADTDRVRAALGRSRLGGYLYPGTPGGTAVLFDPPKPRFGRISRSRLLDPAFDLAFELKAPVWVLEDDGRCAGATACFAGGGFRELSWAADWTPPADPAARAAHRAEWDAYCAKTAEKAGLPDPAALAAVRNDPAPDGSRPSGEEVLRRLCAVVGASDTAVGQSLFHRAGPRGRDFVRFEARRR